MRYSNEKAYLNCLENGLPEKLLPVCFSAGCRYPVNKDFGPFVLNKPIMGCYLQFNDHVATKLL